MTSGQFCNIFKIAYDPSVPRLLLFPPKVLALRVARGDLSFEACKQKNNLLLNLKSLGGKLKINIQKIFSLCILGTGIYWYNNNYWRSVWWDKWFFLILSCVGFLSYKVYEKYNFLVGIFVALILSSALWVFGWRNSYPAVDLTTLVALGKVSAYSYLAFITCLFCVMQFKKEDYEIQTKLFAVFCMINSIYIIYQSVMGVPATARGGMFGNPSMSGCLIAFTYPFLVLKEIPGSFTTKTKILIFRCLKIFIPFIAIVLTDSSQPMGVFAVVVCAWFYAKHKGFSKIVWSAIVGMLTVGFGILWAMSDSNNGVFDSSGRSKIWALVMKWFFINGHVLFGQGTGTSQIIIPILQRDSIPPGVNPSGMDWWIWLHSDWIQLILENGVLGFISGIFVALAAFFDSFYKAPWLFAAVCGVVATAFFNFPVHWPIHAFIMVVIAGMTFDHEYLIGRYHEV